MHLKVYLALKKYEFLYVFLYVMVMISSDPFMKS